MTKYRAKRACQVCGKPFYGIGDHHYCPDCARQKKLDTVVKIRTCQSCGIEFYGGPRAKRCPDCAYKAKQTINKKHGTKRPLGSVDKCIICGQDYVATSGRQKYCSEVCQRIGVLTWQRERKKGYYKSSGQDLKKQERRESKEKICVYCLRNFKSNTPTNTCSDFCRSEQQKINQCVADIKRGYKRDLKKYEDKRAMYREKLHSSSG